ncbi:hypothetical protein L8C07_07385 [Paenibacillus sp. CMAA1739]|nr:hypothetical protein [Paenibacillus sp. CMAA1739]MEC4565764.1 hypothetical protein [Paenibacillus sp. CMAA1739]
MQQELDTARTHLRHWEHFHADYNLYAYTTPIAWQYSQERPKGDVLKSERRAYVHLYFNKEKETDDANKLNRRLTRLKAELESGKREPAHEKVYPR